MTHQEMQSLINSMVQKVQKSSGAGADAAVEAIVRGLQEWVSEYESDLAEQLDYRGFAVVSHFDRGKRVETEVAPTLLRDEMRLWQHMYRVLDNAGSKLRYMPRKKAKKRGKKKSKGTRATSLSRIAAAKRAMRGT